MLVVFSSPEFGCNHWVISVGKGISHVWDEVHYSCFFFFSNSCGCLQLCITDTSSVNIACSLMLRRCYNWLWLNELFLSQQIEEFRSFYLCGRKVVDLQFQTADGRLAENDGFITAFHLNRQRHKVSSETQFRKVHYLHSSASLLCKPT